MVVEKKFIYLTNVGISENYITNFFDISVHQLMGERDFSLSDKNAAIECINEKELFYKTIEAFARENADEKNLNLFAQSLEQMLVQNPYSYIATAEIKIMSLEDNSDFVIRSFNCAKV